MYSETFKIAFRSDSAGVIVCTSTYSEYIYYANDVYSVCVFMRRNVQWIRNILYARVYRHILHNFNSNVTCYTVLFCHGYERVKLDL